MTEEYTKDDLLAQLWAEVNLLRNRNCRTCQSWEAYPSGRLGECQAVDSPEGHFWVSDKDDLADEGILKTTPNFYCAEYLKKESDVTEGSEDD